MLYYMIALCVLLLIVTYLFQWYYRAFNNAAHRHNALLADYKECIKAHDEVVLKYNEAASMYNGLVKELKKQGVVLL